MRRDTEVYFVKEEQGEFDYSTGNYVPGAVIEHKRNALVNDMQEQRQMLLYGALKRGTITIRLLGHFRDDFDYIGIKYGDFKGKYQVDTERKLRSKHVFNASRVG